MAPRDELRPEDLDPARGYAPYPGGPPQENPPVEASYTPQENPPVDASYAPPQENPVVATPPVSPQDVASYAPPAASMLPPGKPEPLETPFSPGDMAVGAIPGPKELFPSSPVPGGPPQLRFRNVPGSPGGIRQTAREVAHSPHIVLSPEDKALWTDLQRRTMMLLQEKIEASNLTAEAKNRARSMNSAFIAEQHKMLEERDKAMTAQNALWARERRGELDAREQELANREIEPFSSAPQAFFAMLAGAFRSLLDVRRGRAPTGMNVINGIIDRNMDRQKDLLRRQQGALEHDYQKLELDKTERERMKLKVLEDLKIHTEMHGIKTAQWNGTPEEIREAQKRFAGAPQKEIDLALAEVDARLATVASTQPWVAVPPPKVEFDERQAPQGFGRHSSGSIPAPQAAGPTPPDQAALDRLRTLLERRKRLLTIAKEGPITIRRLPVPEEKEVVAHIDSQIATTRDQIALLEQASSTLHGTIAETEKYAYVPGTSGRRVLLNPEEVGQALAGLPKDQQAAAKATYDAVKESTGDKAAAMQAMITSAWVSRNAGGQSIGDEHDIPLALGNTADGKFRLMTTVPKQAYARTSDRLVASKNFQTLMNSVSDLVSGYSVGDKLTPSAWNELKAKVLAVNGLTSIAIKEEGALGAWDNGSKELAEEIKGNADTFFTASMKARIEQLQSWSRDNAKNLVTTMGGRFYAVPTTPGGKAVDVTTDLLSNPDSSVFGPILFPSRSALPKEMQK